MSHKYKNAECRLTIIPARERADPKRVHIYTFGRARPFVSIPMTFLVFHFDTISCSIEFHFQILSRSPFHSLSPLAACLIESI
jgi:hypothetical protein